ncbi:MAG TPA: winged helix-turn-helix domain-containing protein [Trebonia sp.]|nr:winged helix-turn-helix domain-containing protein [Trebonia sp.]
MASTSGRGPLPGSSAQRTELYKTLTNPVRWRILDYIGQHREANSTSVAKALGESTGTTSYHLRKLAEQHLIEEIPERSAGRERWWRVVPFTHVMAAPGERTPEEESALAEWNSQRLVADFGLYLRAIEEYEGPDGWVQAQRTRTYMTREGLLEFYAEYLGLLAKYGHAEEGAPPGARLMATRFLAIPQAQSQAEPPAS